MIEIPNRRISVDLPTGAKLLTRNARPLNGIEIKQALIVMCHQLALELVDREVLGWEGEPREKCIDSFVDLTKQRLELEWALNRSHITYPGVGWNILVNLEKLSETYSLNAKLTLDLALNNRCEYILGYPDLGPLVGTVEHEQLQTNIPDRMRQDSGLPVEVDFVRQDGTTGKTKIKMARSVELGGGGTRAPQLVEPIPEPIPEPPPAPELPAEELLATPAKIESIQPTKYSPRPKSEIKR